MQFGVRPHWALQPAEKVPPCTPAEVYEHGRTIIIPQWRGWAKAAKNKFEANCIKPTESVS